VTLRTGQSAAAHDAELLDPANQSLADALRITLRLVQGGMLVLAGLFLVSGSQSVRENERGIRLFFGGITRSDVQPGLSINPPYPVGELIRVDVGQAELKLDQQFWIFAANKADLVKPLDQLTKLPNLTPGQGGSNLTADGNLAHTQWKVLYTRENATQWAQNVLPEMEQDLVRTAVQRGVVRACSKTNLDDLLRQTGGDTGVAARAKAIAQAQLDRVRSGIRVQQVLLENVTPPLWVRERFNGVQSAVADATRNLDTAQSFSRSVLTAEAGETVPHLRPLLDEYEGAIEGRGARKPEAVLADINTLMSGDSVVIDGKEVPGVRSGNVASIIAEAKQYRSEVANRRRAEYERFRQKQTQFSTNPRLMIAAEVSEAVRGFLARPETQMILLPPGTDIITLKTDRDPDILRDIKRKMLQAEGDKAQKDRLDLLEKDRFKPKEGNGAAN
jgi:membrane protease subunit HflK